MTSSASLDPSPGDPPASGPRSSTGCWPIAIRIAIYSGIVLLLIALLMPAHRGREPSRRTQCKNNLKQIGLALHNYHDTYGAFPPACTVDADGKPLHSWRTLILPYLDQKPLYDTIDLTKPWDDPANEKARETLLHAYRCPSVADMPPNHTTCLAVAAPGSVFAPGESLKLADITDGARNTLQVLEAPSDRSVPWMSPRDADEALFLSLSKDSNLPHRGGTHALLCDGSVHFLSLNLSPAARRALISIAAGDKVGDF
jgi:hypothetical protein